jgi:hypothetical protein
MPAKSEKQQTAARKSRENDAGTTSVKHRNQLFETGFPGRGPALYEKR